jgi:homoserine acetyltransferase
MKLAREIATVTYRSGPEWEQRFGRQRADPSKPPALCPDFLIETYLDHAGEKFCLEYDPNSLLYVSKAMDLFDLGAEQQTRLKKLREENQRKLYLHDKNTEDDKAQCSLTLPSEPYEEQPRSRPAPESATGGAPADLVEGLKAMSALDTLVLGVTSDILFPAWQQREIAKALEIAGCEKVKYQELGEDLSVFGHDSFLLDLKHIGGAVKKHLE